MGTLAARFATRCPELVSALVLLAPAGLTLPTGMPMILSIARAPCCGAKLIGNMVKASLPQTMDKEWKDKTREPEIKHWTTVLQVHSKRDGFTWSVGRICADYTYGGLKGEGLYAEAAKLGKPTLIVWGDSDGAAPVV